MQDLLVIGGGINGAGIARDAAGRGLKVTLCEMNDFASATSSASSKLIHGGLRYLEHYEFNLVRKSLMEREVLLKSAPHIIWPLRFVLPHHKKLRPAFILRLGLFLYDYIGGRKLLPPTRKVKFSGDHTGLPLQDRFSVGFEYSDCWVDDARLVILNLLDCQKHGGEILKGWRCVRANRMKGHWLAILEDKDGNQKTVKTKAIVNASGAWAADLSNSMKDKDVKKHQLKLVKGSHIIVPKLYDGDHAYTFQESDGRIIFAIPYEGDFTLVGTTDVVHNRDPSDVEISGDETAYLCAAVSEYLKKKVSVEDVVWAYSGVRPLVDDGQANASKVTRDYILDMDHRDGHAPLLSVYGGKITTFRKLAEQAMDDLKAFFPAMRGEWTETAVMSGGDIEGHDTFYHDLIDAYPWAGVAMLKRYTRSYGSLSHTILGGKQSLADMGQHFGADLYEAELMYLRDHEWATCADDVIKRRTKLVLRLSDDEIAEIQNWFEQG